jgi:hypothetical protein
MHPDPSRSHDPAEHKRCSACAQRKPAEDFYASHGRLSSYCKACQRQASRRAYHRRRTDPATRARMRAVDRRRKQHERARLAQLDPDRERRAGRARRAAARRLIAAHSAEYQRLLRQELATIGRGGGRRD